MAMAMSTKFGTGTVGSTFLVLQSGGQAWSGLRTVMVPCLSLADPSNTTARVSGL